MYTYSLRYRSKELDDDDDDDGGGDSVSLLARSASGIAGNVKRHDSVGGVVRGIRVGLCYTGILYVQWQVHTE